MRRGSRTGHCIKVLLFYSVIIYIIYHIFIAEEPLTQAEKVSAVGEEIADQSNIVADDRNIIIRMISWIFSIIPWIFSCIWSMVKFFWSILAFVWSIISYIWTIFILAINALYITFTFNNNMRSWEATTIFFLQTAALFLVVPIINLILIRWQIAINILLPIYLTLFVASFGRNNDSLETVPRNLVFFVMVCAWI